MASKTNQQLPFDLRCGDNLKVLPTLPDESVHSVVTDPPYGLRFMGKRWDCDVPGVAVWAECLRVLRPGGHLLAFAGTRTQHRMACNIEDAGFEIRDMIAWVYGQGFPKSLSVSKEIDRAAGVEREKVRVDASKVRNPKTTRGGRDGTEGATRPCIEAALERGYHTKDSDTPVTNAARQWNGWGTGLKPALEPITLARKPLSKSVAENIVRHGTGALNINGCRVSGDFDTKAVLRQSKANGFVRFGTSSNIGKEIQMYKPGGLWPANLIHDGSVEVDSTLNGCSRFFYCPKTTIKDRLDGCMLKINNHPTVKPTALMLYLCRLITPPGGVVLDPFMGSGSTGRGAVFGGFQFIGIEMDREYVEIAEARVKAAYKAHKTYHAPSID